MLARRHGEERGGGAVELSPALGAHREREVAPRVVEPRELEVDPAQLERALGHRGAARRVKICELLAMVREPVARLGGGRARQRERDLRVERERMPVAELAL